MIFSQEKSKTKKNNLSYESYEKTPVMKLEY